MRRAAALFKARRSQACVFYLAMLLLLNGCGFHSVYASRDTDSPVADDLNNVKIANIADRNGQILRNELIDRMYRKGRPQSPDYTLEITIRTTEEGIGLLPNAITTLNELSLYADYTLKDNKGKTVISATAHAAADYDQLQQEYGTLAAHDTAIERCLVEVSDQIVERMGLYFSEGPPANQKPGQEPKHEGRDEPSDLWNRPNVNNPNQWNNGQTWYNNQP